MAGLRIVIATTAPDVGGVSRHVFDLSHGLRARGHSVVVAVRRDAEPIREAAQEQGLATISLERSASVRAHVWHLQLHNSLDTRALPLLVARRAHGRGIAVLTEHLPRVPRTDPLFPKHPELLYGPPRPGAAQMKPMLKRAEATVAHKIITVSDSSRSFLERRWCIDASRLVTIHNGVDIDTARPDPRNVDRMRVMGVASVHWLKGFDVLLDAAERAREAWDVRIIGEGAARMELQTRAEAMRASRHIEFTGWRPDARTAALEGDVLCAPSRAESFSYVILEAMACARPVVAAAVDGAQEAVADGRNGLLVPPEDPAALADALDRLARDPELRRRLGVAAYDRVCAEFSLSQMIDATAELYERLLGRQRRSD
jgi:glycosyltransferase involved in cell wall biosynthesis